MADPYGITQVDVPGIMQAYQSAQMNRIQQLMAQKQLMMFGRQMGAMNAIQAYMTGQDGAPSAPISTAPTSTAPSGAPAASSAPTDPLAPLPATSAAAPAASAASAPASANPFGDMGRRNALIGQLMYLDPEMASNVAQTFSTMDEDQLKTVQGKALRVSQLATGAMQLSDPQARRDFIQRNAGELQQDLGYSPQQIASFNPTDQNLRALIGEGMDTANIAGFVQPKVTAVRDNSYLVSTNPMTGKSTEAFASPTITVPGVGVFSRSQVDRTASPSAPLTATNPKTGQRLQFNTQTNQWEPIGGQTGSGSSGGFQ